MQRSTRYLYSTNIFIEYAYRFSLAAVVGDYELMEFWYKKATEHGKMTLKLGYSDKYKSIDIMNGYIIRCLANMKKIHDKL